MTQFYNDKVAILVDNNNKMIPSKICYDPYINSFIKIINAYYIFRVVIRKCH